MKFLTWVVKIQIHESWVRDGFVLDSEKAHEMVANLIGGAFNNEIKTSIVSAPDRGLIRETMGYLTKRRKVK